MSEILSQDQIDQLLSAGGFGSENLGESDSGGATPSEGDQYPSLEKSIQLFCKQGSTVLTTVLNKKVSLTCEVCGKSDFATIKTALQPEHQCVALVFKSGFDGTMHLLINNNDVAAMGDLMMMGDGNAAYTAEHNDALTELSNQMMSSFTLAFTSELGEQVSSSPSFIEQCSIDYPPSAPEMLDMAIIKMSIESREETTCVMLIPQALTMQIASKYRTDGTSARTDSGGNDGFGVNQDIANQFSQGASSPMGFAGAPSKSIEMLLDVDLDVSIELGKTNLSIKRILELAPGSIIELDRMAGEPVDLLVNNKPVAKGEVVVIDESFGIRILSLVSAEDRIKSLR
jgi:flagellar motor switch protein FliN